MLNTADANVIVDLGYKIISDHEVSLYRFMQENFPGFDLLKLLKVVEQFFTPTSETQIHRLLIINTENLSLEINYENEHISENDALLFNRRFIVVQNKIHVHHDFCVIPREHRNKGYIKPVFQESLKQYISMDVHKILVHARLSGGGYVWAKHGFVAVNKKELDAISENATLC